ncbi:MAG: bifunctional nuclease family protein [bacterium]
MGQERAGSEHETRKRLLGQGATPAPNGALVPLRVQRVVLINDVPAVLLLERGGTRYLLIFIDFFMANAIRSGMIGPQLERPLTHDLIGILLSRLGGKVNKITITALKDNTYYALISLQVNGRVEEIDARPSDALAIAVRTRAPIYADKALLKPLPGKGEDRKGSPPPVPKRPEPAKGST